MGRSSKSLPPSSSVTSTRTLKTPGSAKVTLAVSVTENGKVPCGLGSGSGVPDGSPVSLK